MSTFLLIVLGIIIGWFIPRPYFIGDLEDRWIGPIKDKVPYHLRWWLYGTSTDNFANNQTRYCRLLYAI